VTLGRLQRERKNEDRAADRDAATKIATYAKALGDGREAAGRESAVACLLLTGGVPVWYPRDLAGLYR
jgi:hypothetical protein